jgi:hypothetical protein
MIITPLLLCQTYNWKNTRILAAGTPPLTAVLI